MEWNKMIFKTACIHVYFAGLPMLQIDPYITDFIMFINSMHRVFIRLILRIFCISVNHPFPLRYTKIGFYFASKLI